MSRQFDPYTWKTITEAVKARLDKRVQRLMNPSQDKSATIERLGVDAVVDRAVIAELQWILNLESNTND